MAKVGQAQLIHFWLNWDRHRTIHIYVGNIFNIISNKLDIIGIDIDIMIILVPISILLAIAASPESLQILTANSDKNAIPVILTKSVKNVLLIEALLASDCSNIIIPCNLSLTNNNIKTPVNKLM